MTSCNHTDKRMDTVTREIKCAECGAALKMVPAQVQPAPELYDRLIRGQRAGWQDVGELPPMDQPYYAAWQTHYVDPNDPASWFVVRVLPGRALPALATHWHADALGLPQG